MIKTAKIVVTGLASTASRPDCGGDTIKVIVVFTEIA